MHLRLSESGKLKGCQMNGKLVKKEETLYEALNADLHSQRLLHFDIRAFQV